MDGNNIDYSTFETKLLKIYPNLSENEAKIIIKQLFIFWWNMIEDMDKFKK